MSAERKTATPTRRLALLVALTAAFLALSGCCDDIICPPYEVVPFITAELLEYDDGDAQATRARIFCSADPLPDFLVAYVNGRGFENVGLGEPVGLSGSFEESLIIWQAGAPCSLHATTNFGYAVATVRVPAPFAVWPPDDIVVGDTLKIAWAPSDDADFYIVDAMLTEGTWADTVELYASVTETSVVFMPELIIFPGVVSGHVLAVSGPKPGVGAPGNITQDGHGFFNVSYYDTLSMFECTVTETALP